MSPEQIKKCKQKTYFEEWFDGRFPKDTWNQPFVLREAFREIAWEAYQEGIAFMDIEKSAD